ncbi:hypothetical protein QTN25_009104 [Entamoeba marina]
MNNTKNRIQIAFLGDYNVGKTTFKNMLVWDVHLQEKYIPFPNVIRPYLKKNIIIMFDVNDKQSFDYALFLLRLCKDEKFYNEMVLVGNKTDLGNRQVQKDEGERVAKEFGCLNYFETSLIENQHSEVIMEILFSVVDKNNYQQVQPVIQPNHQPNNHWCSLQ